MQQRFVDWCHKFGTNQCKWKGSQSINIPFVNYIKLINTSESHSETFPLQADYIVHNYLISYFNQVNAD